MAQMDEGVWYILQEATGVPTSDNLQSLPHLSGGKNVWRQAIQHPAQYYCDYMRQFGIFPDCNICGCGFEGHVQSHNHFKRLWQKLDLENRLEPMPSMRGRYWQEIQVRKADCVYTVRFNHADFEMQICRGQPPPPPKVVLPPGLPPNIPLAPTHMARNPPAQPFHPYPIAPQAPPSMPTSYGATNYSGPPPPPSVHEYHGGRNTNPPPPPPTPPSKNAPPSEIQSVLLPLTDIQCSAPLALVAWQEPNAAAIATPCPWHLDGVSPPEVGLSSPQPMVRFADRSSDNVGGIPDVGAAHLCDVSDQHRSCQPPLQALGPPAAPLQLGLPAQAGLPTRPNSNRHSHIALPQESVPEMQQLTLRSKTEIMAAVLKVQQDLLKELENGNGSGCVLRWAAERAAVDEAVVEAARPELPATPPAPPPLVHGMSAEADVPTSQLPLPPMRQSPTVPSPVTRSSLVEDPPMVQLGATPPVTPSLVRSPYVEDF